MAELGLPDSLTSMPDRMTWEGRRAVRAFVASYGLAGVGLIVALLVAGTAACMGYVLRLMAEHSQVPATPIFAPADISNTNMAIEGARRTMAEFDSALIRFEDSPRVVEDLIDRAQENGLILSKAEYSTTLDPDGGFARYQMNLPIKGSGDALLSYVHVAMQRHQSLALRSLQIKRERAATQDVEGRIELTLFARLPKSDPLVHLPANDEVQKGGRP